MTAPTTGARRALRDLTRKLNAHTLWAFNPQPELSYRRRQEAPDTPYRHR
jgi:hypothetical protein